MFVPDKGFKAKSNIKGSSGAYAFDAQYNDIFLPNGLTVHAYMEKHSGLFHKSVNYQT